MKMFVVLALAAVAVAEPEADPALLYSGAHYTTGYSGYPTTYMNYPRTYGYPLARTYAAAPAVTYAAAPAVTYAAAPAVTYAKTYTTPHVYNTHVKPVVAAPTQVITNYQNPQVYTARATHLGAALGVPNYVAKSGPVVHAVQKREAEAEPEADPALLYSGHYATPAVTYAAAPVHTYAAAPAVAYASAPHLSYAANAYAYPYAGVYRAPHAVAATHYGYTHSSNVGLCYNTYGGQVPC